MTKSDEKVWAAYSELAGADGIAAPTLGELVELTGLSPQTLRRATHALIMDGRLRQISTGGGRGAPNYYEVMHTRYAPIVDSRPPLTLVETVPENPTNNPTKPYQEWPGNRSKNLPTGESDPRVTKPLKGFGNSRSGQSPVAQEPENATKNGSVDIYGKSYPDGYLRCQCGKPKILGDADCPWCQRPYPYVSEPRRAEWHPSEGPRDANGELEIPPAVAESIQEIADAIRKASQQSRFRRWNKNK